MYKILEDYANILALIRLSDLMASIDDFYPNHSNISSVQAHWFLLFSMIYNALLFIIILMLSLSQGGQWEFLCLFLHAPIITVIILSPSLVSRLLILPCFGLRVRHFSQEPWFLLLGNHCLSARCVFKPFHQAELRNRWSLKVILNKCPSLYCSSLPFHILCLYLSFPYGEPWLPTASAHFP